MSEKNQNDISSRSGDIPKLTLSQKEIKPTNKYKKKEIFETNVPTSQEYLRKNSERYLIQNLRYPYICLISVKK